MSRDTSSAPPGDAERSDVGEAHAAAPGSPDAPWLSEAERRELSKRTPDSAIVFALAFTGLVASFMMTLMTPLLPELPHLLSSTGSPISSTDAMWAVTATLLSAAIFTPIGGSLGDLYGKRRIILVLLASLVLGSVIAAFASTLIPLVIGRALQGAGLGVIPLGISVLRDVLHRDRLGKAVALV
ncbi:MAG: MFS transporter, partial [Microterricola sp.]